MPALIGDGTKEILPLIERAKDHYPENVLKLEEDTEPATNLKTKWRYFKECTQLCGENENETDWSSSSDIITIEERRTLIERETQKPQEKRLSDIKESRVEKLWRLIKANRGFGFSFLASIFHASRQVCTKTLTQMIHPTELVVLERIIIIILCLPYLLKSKAIFQLPVKENRWYVVGIGILSGLAGLLVNYSFNELHAGDVSAILGTMPVFVGLMECAFLNEPFTIWDIAFCMFALLGIMTASEPQVLNFANDRELSQHEILGIGFAILATIVLASSIVLKRRLMINKMNALLSVFYFATVAALTGALVCSVLEKWTVPPMNWASLLLIAIGCFAFGTTLFGLAALDSISAYFSSVILLNNIVFSYIIESIFLKNFPDIWKIIGTMLIIFSSSGLLIIRHFRSNSETNNDNNKNEIH